MDAVRRDTRSDGADPEERWQRALYDLALHQLDDLDAHLAQLRDGPAPAPPGPRGRPRAGPPPPPRAVRCSAASAAPSGTCWTDEATWSGELYQILGLDPARPALTLDELPSLVLEEDRPRLTAMVTDCLVDAKPIDGEFRVVHGPTPPCGPCT